MCIRDSPGISPLHCFLRDAKRARYTSATDEDALKASGIKSVQNIGDSNAPGAVVHAVYAGHLYANTFDQEDGLSNNDFKLEYPVIQ